MFINRIIIFDLAKISLSEQQQRSVQLSLIHQQKKNKQKKQNTIHQLTTMISTSKLSYFQLITTC